LSEEKRSGVEGNDFEIWKTGPGINGKQVFSPVQRGKYRKILILPLLAITTLVTDRYSYFCHTYGRKSRFSGGKDCKNKASN
jgi:hypothetical protein